MREERIGRALSNGLVFLPLLFAAAFLVLGYDGAWLVFFYGLWCIASALLVGRLLGRKPVIVQLLACTAASATALLLPILPLVRYIAMAAGLLIALFVERTVLKEVEFSLGNRLLLPLGTVLAAVAFIWIYTGTTEAEPGGSYRLLFAMSALWLAVSLVLTHRSAYRDAAFANTQREIPAGARRSGAVGILLLTAVVFAMTFSGPIGRALGTLFGGIGNALKTFFLWLGELFASGDVEPEPEMTGELDMNQFVPMETTDGMSPFAQAILYIITALVLLSMLALAIYGLKRLLPKIWRELSGWARRVFGDWREDAVAYSDHDESLLTLRQAMQDAGKGLKRFARRFRPRPKLEDCPTNEAKVRFLFQEYLRKLQLAGRPAKPGDTPTDVVGPEGRALWEPYNRARYDGAEPTDGEIDAARVLTRGK